MKVVFSILSILTLFFGSFSQKIDSCDIKLEGVILDVDTKSPLPFVQVQVKDTDYYSVTDVNGRFYFKGLCNQLNTLIVSCFGYCDTICEGNHKHGKTPHIYLKQNSSCIYILK